MDKFKDHVKEKDGHKVFEMDKDIPGEYFQAVIFTCKMLNKGLPFDFAVCKSSGFYKVKASTIIDYLPEYAKQ